MWVENVRTGKKWHVSEERAKQLLRNEDFVEVQEPKPKAPAKKKTGD